MPLSVQQLIQYAQNAGYQGQSLVQVVSIALAESGGDPNAYNPNDPNGGSYGVLQINGAHFTPTSSKSQGNTTTKSCALDPQCAFNYSYKLSNGGTNYSAWGTFTSGAYKGFLSQVNEAFSKLTGAGNNAGGSTYPATCPPFDLACAASSFFSSNQVRQVGLLFIGLVLLLIGIEILFFGKGKEEKE